jgi:hypothetical protein
MGVAAAGFAEAMAHDDERLRLDDEQVGNVYAEQQTAEQQGQILGLKKADLLRLGRAAVDLGVGVMPSGVSRALIELPAIAHAAPDILDTIESKGEVRPEDVRPHRETIMQVHAGARLAGRLAAGAEACTRPGKL